ncbi:hypothetical protein BC939DRAFT_497867 [Gamsiella multidivaricata]|nr:hypothetical protein BC939DRAFT_497867 [Gamsiella multidivaricata]
MRLLEQRGAVGEPIPPLGFREANKKLISMASVVHKLKVPSNQTIIDTVVATDSPAVQSAKPVESANVLSLAGNVKIYSQHRTRHTKADFSKRWIVYPLRERELGLDRREAVIELSMRGAVHSDN